MKIIRAEHWGMCFGVRDALALANRQNAHAPLTILGDLVHNEIILAQLRSQGIHIQQSAAGIATQNVMITAHGASQNTIHQLESQGLNVIEATCPLVRFAHQTILRLVADGFYPVIIGKPDHVEVRGLTGDLAAFDVVQNEADVLKLAQRPRFGIAAQTTQPIDRVQSLVAKIRHHFPRSEVRFVDTVCRPTRQRQSAAVALARQCDVVIVIGGAHSNNTRELVATCRLHCPQVQHIQNAQDLREEWFAGAQTVGLTAGTSTSDGTLHEVERWLEQFQTNLDTASLAVATSEF